MLACCCLSLPAGAQEPAHGPQLKPSRLKPSEPVKIDRSGKPRHGKASYYGPGFAGKPMADGTPMNPKADIAASRTLPLGTRAKVKNLENGKTAVVEIRDRGPYVDGRIVDLSSGVADKLGMKEQGVVPVVVTPIELPPATPAEAPATEAAASVPPRPAPARARQELAAE